MVCTCQGFHEIIIFSIIFFSGARVVEMIMWHMKVKRVLPHTYFSYIGETPHSKMCFVLPWRKSEKIDINCTWQDGRSLAEIYLYIYSTLLTSDRCPLYSSLRKVLSPLLNFPCFLQCNIGSVSSKKWQKTSDFFSTSVSFHTLREHVNGQSVCFYFSCWTNVGCTFVGCAARHGDPIG